MSLSFKSKKRRRTAEKKNAKRFQPNRMDLVLGGFPKSKMVKLRYVEELQLDAASGVPAVHVWRANSLYDPNSSGVGHQPSNFDTWSNIYDHYTVLGSKITVQYVPDSSTSITPAFVGIALSDSGTTVAGSSTTELLERKLTQSSRRSVGLISSYAFKPIVHTFSASKFFGRPKNVLIGDGTYRGKMGNFGTGSDPSEQAFYEVFTTSINGNNPGIVNFLVTIDYVAVLTEPKPTDSS